MNPLACIGRPCSHITNEITTTYSVTKLCTGKKIEISSFAVSAAYTKITAVWVISHRKWTAILYQLNEIQSGGGRRRKRGSRERRYTALREREGWRYWMKRRRGYVEQAGEDVICQKHKCVKTLLFTKIYSPTVPLFKILCSFLFYLWDSILSLSPTLTLHLSLSLSSMTSHLVFSILRRKRQYT